MICPKCGFHFWGVSFCPNCKTDKKELEKLGESKMKQNKPNCERNEEGWCLYYNIQCKEISYLNWGECVRQSKKSEEKSKKEK